jgi:uncharacterized protein (TIGR02145 family)
VHFVPGVSSGFSAFPAGLHYFGGGFSNRGEFAVFWEAAEVNASNANLRSLSEYNMDLFEYNFYKTYGFSVRCLKDSN